MPPLHLAARSPIPSRFSQRRLVNRTTGERRWLPTTERSCMSARSLGVRADPAVSSRVRHPGAVPLGAALLSVVLLGGVGSVAQEEANRTVQSLSLIHISEPTRRTPISYAVFCLKKKKKKKH